MQFNFYDQYKRYSNFDLLKILQQPGDYQPAAVQAAELILKEREVSDQEHAAVNNHFEAIQEKEQVKQEKINLVRNKVFDFFEPLIRPGNDFHPVKWLNVLLLITAGQYLADIFERLSTGRFFPLAVYTNGGLWYYIFAFIDILSLVYVPWVIYMVLKRKRWGWIIFADTMFSLIVRISETYMLFKYIQFNEANPVMHFLTIIFRCVLLYFLWRKQVSDVFGVSAKTKKDTALMVLIGTPIFLVFIYMFIK
jgi:hypothetical protein